MSKEEIPLHEIVLDILYHEDVTKPKPMATEEVLWKVENPDIALYHVKAVLEWLRLRGELEYRFSKYLLTEATFLELKEQFSSNKNTLTITAKERRKAAQMGNQKPQTTSSKKVNKTEQTKPKKSRQKRENTAHNIIKKQQAVPKKETIEQQKTEVTPKAEQKEKGLKQQFQKWWHKISRKEK